MNSSRNAALLKHNQPVPRYTSYPTAPNFEKVFAEDTVSGWMRDITPDEPVSLYFHVPFCKKMCWYCGCNTKATAQYAAVEDYLVYLRKEVDLVTQKHQGRLNVAHIHFGGGSPSYIRPDGFDALMDHIRARFNLLSDAEVAIELDPRETSEAKVAAYAKAGVTRASLGVQDFNRTVQQAINRVQPLHLVYEAVETLRQYGIDAISFDLLYGLPNQTVENVKQSVSLAAALNPDRIALFGYAHVPWMKKHMRLIDEESLPGALLRLEQFEAARQILCEKGYQEIGLDHFVQPDDQMAIAHIAGRLQRNFQGYTTDGASTLIGFGPSAISSYADGYSQNTPDLRSYTKRILENKLPVARGLAPTADDRLRRGIISSLMCYGAVDLSDIVAEYDCGQPDFAIELGKLKELEQDGLVLVDGSRITVNKNAPQACRLVAAAFDTYLTPKKQQHAQIA